MPIFRDTFTENELKRLMRPDAHRFLRGDWRRYWRPGYENDPLYRYYENIERKYRDDQPRVPRGNPDGGQWTSDGGGGSADNGRSPDSSNRNSRQSNQQVAQLLPFLLSEPPVVPRPVIEPPTELGPIVEPPIEPSPAIKPPLEEWPTNPTETPPGYEWRGRPGSSPGDGRGSYVKRGPDGEIEETLRPDFNNRYHDPHYDYRTPDGNWYRWYPDGTMEPHKPIIIFRLET